MRLRTAAFVMTLRNRAGTSGMGAHTIPRWQQFRVVVRHIVPQRSASGRSTSQFDVWCVTLCRSASVLADGAPHGY